VPPTAAEESYAQASALMVEHRFVEAAPILREAVRRGVKSPPREEAIAHLLERAETALAFSPPRYAIPNASPLVVYCAATDKWSAPILAGIPEIAKIGHAIFGNELPATRLYLFPERPAFDKFYGALFNQSIPTWWQDATGSRGVVIACGKDRNGTITRPHGDPETTSCVFHEFGHSWMNDYVAIHHGKSWLGSMRSPLLDEGVSDYIAARREPAYLTRRERWIASVKVTRGLPPPAFDELLGYKTFY